MKTKNRVAIAKDFQRRIAKLQREREKLLKKAVRTLKVVNDNYTWAYLMNNQCGSSTFLERLKTKKPSVHHRLKLGVFNASNAEMINLGMAGRF